MEIRIKIRQRAPKPPPWKWEIYVGERLVTASADSYASQAEAHEAAQQALETERTKSAIRKSLQR